MASVRRTPGVDSWQVRYRDPNGHQRNKNFKRRVEAGTTRTRATCSKPSKCCWPDGAAPRSRAGRLGG